MNKMFWWWVLVMVVSAVLRIDIVVAVRVICINMHYIADEIIKMIDKAAQ